MSKQWRVLQPRDRLQFEAFRAIRKHERKKGKNNNEAFMIAVVATSDDVYVALPAGSLQRYLDFKKKEEVLIWMIIE